MFKKKDTKQLTKHDILADIEEKARTRYFQDVEKLRYPTSVLNGQNYTQIMREKLYKYGYYNPDIQRLDNYNLMKREGLGYQDFKKHRDRLIAEYNQLLHDVDQQIEQRIRESIEHRNNNHKPGEKTILELIIGRPLASMERKSQKDPQSEFYLYLMGTHTLQEWLNIFNQLWQTKPKITKDKDKRQKRIDEKNKRRIQHTGTVPYPFKSKIKAYQKQNPDVQYEQTVSDLGFDKKTLKNVKRPYYSKYPGCWEIDHAFNVGEQGDAWLFCVNVNTRYLVVYPIAEQAEEVQRSIEDLMSHFKVTSIRGDGSTSYSTAATKKDSVCSTKHLDQFHSNYISNRTENPTINLMKMYQRKNINIYFNGGKFTNHNRIVDVVIKTIRNAIGYRKLNVAQVQEIVDYYNFTPHRSLRLMGNNGYYYATPAEVQDDEELEWQYIRQCDEKLLEVMKYQQVYGLTKYQRGNILMVRIDLGKTADKNEKRRRYYDRLGEFIEYVNGNVRVILNKPVLITPTKSINEVIIPIYNTKFVSKNKESIPAEVIRVYGTQWVTP